jgi:hypothetical protein
MGAVDRVNDLSDARIVFVVSFEFDGYIAVAPPIGVRVRGNGPFGNWRVGLRVPKRDLISATLVLLQNGRLKIADALPLKDVLVKELLNFRVKINISTSHDSYEAWREGDHDDLVLSVAMACWVGERFLREPALATVYAF